MQGSSGALSVAGDGVAKSETSIITDMDIEAYHADEAISRSNIMTFKKTPKHYWYERYSGRCKASTPTEEMILGNAVHTFVLEPGQFHKRYYIWQKQNKTTKAGKASWLEASTIAAENNLTIINSEQYNQIQEMYASIMGNQVAKDLVEGGKYEQSLFWIDNDTGLACKARPDIWQHGFVGDLKTCNTAAPRAFERAIHDYGYHIQAAMIQEAIKSCTGELINDFVFIAIEKTPPYAVCCYGLDSIALEVGSAIFHETLNNIKHCMDIGEWPSYPDAYIGLPKWVE